MKSALVSTDQSLLEISITEHGVFTLLSQIDPYKACGPDDIPAWVLQELAQKLTPMITDLFKQSLYISELPLEWKSVYVTQKIRDLIHQITDPFL